MADPWEVARRAAAASPINLAGKCQRFAGLFWSAAMGQQAPGGYADAKGAYNASDIVSFDPMAAPPGAMHYFVYEPYGHVGPALGDGIMASGTGNRTGFVQDLGNGVLASRVADYNRTYLGWSHTNGNRPRITAFDGNNAPAGGGGYQPITPTGGIEMLAKDPAGNYTFADDFGSENIAKYMDSNMTSAEVIAALTKFEGVSSLSQREADLVRSIYQRRWEAKRNEIVSEVDKAISDESTEKKVDQIIAEGGSGGGGTPTRPSSFGIKLDLDLNARTATGTATPNV